jgi:hypothetical protein
MAMFMLHIAFLLALAAVHQAHHPDGAAPR